MMFSNYMIFFFTFIFINQSCAKENQKKYKIYEK